MTAREILGYLNSDEARKAKFAKLNFVNGETAKLVFTRDEQIKECADANIWMAVVPDKTSRMVEFKGENVTAIKPDNTPIPVPAPEKPNAVTAKAPAKVMA